MELKRRLAFFFGGGGTRIKMGFTRFCTQVKEDYILLLKFSKAILGLATLPIRQAFTRTRALSLRLSIGVL